MPGSVGQVILRPTWPLSTSRESLLQSIDWNLVKRSFQDTLLKGSPGSMATTLTGVNHFRSEVQRLGAQMDQDFWAYLGDLQDFAGGFASMWTAGLSDRSKNRQQKPIYRHCRRGTNLVQFFEVLEQCV